MCYTGCVQKAARIFRSFAEADEAEQQYYRSLTPGQRLQVLLDLVQSQQSDEPEQRLERICRVIKLQED